MIRLVQRVSGAAFCVVLAISADAEAGPVSFVFFEGYDPLAFSGSTTSTGPSGLENLNRRIRDQFRGENYFSRVFQWNQIDSAVNFVNNLPDSEIYVVGYSRGGNSIVEFAEQLGPRSISRAVMLDPVRCAGDLVVGCVAGLDVQGQSPATIEFSIWPPSLDVSFQSPIQEYTINSVGTIDLPANIESGTNYFQTVNDIDRAISGPGVRIQGDPMVGNAENINAELAFNPNITHLSIDDDPGIQQVITTDMASRLDGSTLFTGFGGSVGFGALAMTRNDDGSTARIDLPFDVNFGGATHSSLFINNNGNVTFDGPLGQFTPQGFSGLTNSMIAPFWADVDTRCANCGEVYVAAPSSDTFVVTWNNVGFFNQNASLTNTFQLVLRDRYDLTGDVFDIEFRYDDINWTTGDASGGIGGVGGTPAFAGFTGDTNTAPQQLNGSGSAEISQIDSRSNIGKNGVFVFQVADGGVPGTSFDNPLLPDVIDGTWNFQFTTTVVEEIVWSDPIVAVGYDYNTIGSSLFRSFILPTNIGDGIYELWLADGSDYTLVDPGLVGGVEYLFAGFGLNGGADFFRILGIEVEAELDPLDVTAFVTGLSFMQPGQQEWTQRPILFDSDSEEPSIQVAEPSALVLLSTAFGIVFMGLRAWRRV